MHLKQNLLSFIIDLDVKYLIEEDTPVEPSVTDPPEAEKTQSKTVIEYSEKVKEMKEQLNQETGR